MSVEENLKVVDASTKAANDHDLDRFESFHLNSVIQYRNRASAEILHDILNAIRRAHEENRRIVLSDIGRRANLPNGRLKDRLEQLLILGLISARMQLTERGQAYCADYNKFVEPFLQKYGLHSGRNEPIRVSFD